MTTIFHEKYLTLQQMISQIKDELYIRGGRVSTVDLVRELNMDSHEINRNVSEIARSNELQLVAGSLIAHYYLEEIAREINIMLQTQGKISVCDLTSQFDLTADVLQHYVLEKYLGTIIIAKQDPSDPTLFYTEEYTTRVKAKIRGALMGLLQPTVLDFLIDYLNIELKLFFNLFEQLNDTGTLTNLENPRAWPVYESSVHAKSKDDWFIGSYKMNNSVSCYSLEEADIYDYEEYMKRILPNEDLIFLKYCVINSQLKLKLEAAVEKCITSKSYLKVSSFLNIGVCAEDIEMLLSPLLKKYNIIVFDNSVCSYQFIDYIKQACLPMIQKQAEENLNYFEIINIKDIQIIVKDTLNNEYMDHVVTAIAEYILGQLEEEQSKIFTQNRINYLISDIKLYEKGLKLFPINQQPHFFKYLQKSLGEDVLTELCKHAAKLCNVSIEAGVLSVEQRNKIIDELSKEYKQPLHTLTAVLEQNMEQFYQAVDVCLFQFGMILNKNDKKKERLLVQNHREKLISKMENCEEPALVLHLVVLVLFIDVTENMLHASGSEVPLIILFLKTYLKEDDFDKVQKYHEMVAFYATASEEHKETIYKKLKEDLPLLMSVKI